MRKFNFRKYDVRAISIEHNYTKNRSHIHELLAANNFMRKFEGLSRWDDWHIKVYS